jgi:hypothetical protein
VQVRKAVIEHCKADGKNLIYFVFVFFEEHKLLSNKVALGVSACNRKAKKNIPCVGSQTFKESLKSS